MHTILLAGAALVGLPILLHLIMKQEPKRLTFPAFRFLTQKLKTNQRKLRLRHFLLLALRMLLIALFTLAVYQPTLKSDRLNLRGEQPVAAVLVLDTSPSMGYTANDRTRLEDAKKRALELLDELPDKSPVAVVTTDDPLGSWGDIPAARKLIEKIDRPRGAGQSVTSALTPAYQLLTRIETADGEDGNALPKLVAVFTDRAAASWDPGRVEDLKKLRERIPDPKPAHVVADVGVEMPVNVAILAAEMKPQVIPANQPAVVSVDVAAAGSPDAPPVDTVVTAQLDNLKPEPKRVVVPYGQSRVVTFEFRNLKPGLHQVEFKLEAPDRLMADNTRFLTFRVGESRRVLTVADDPEAAVFWQAAHITRGEFGCLVVKPDQVETAPDGRTVVKYPDPEKPNGTVENALREFDVVCLLGVKNPNEPAGNTLWDKLRPYVEGGGKLVVVPGGEATSVEGYNAAKDLMPGTLKGVIDTRKVEPAPPPQMAPGWDPPQRSGKNGVTWFLDPAVTQHPMLRPFQQWQQKGNVDVVRNPRMAWKYWDVQRADGAAVVVPYNDAEKPADRRPAVLERAVADPKNPKGAKGRVLLLTTRLEVPTPDDTWNDYWETEGSTWFAVFPWLVARYTAGDTADANFNYLAGQEVPVPLPKAGAARGVRVVIDGPGIVGDLAAMDVGAGQTELRVRPPQTNQPGNFQLIFEAAKWRDGFSLNVPAEESTLAKAPVEGVEELTGKDTVVPIERDVAVRDRLPIALGQPIDLFPWLLIAVLLLLAVEGLVANRFYRRVK